MPLPMRRQRAAVSGLCALTALMAAMLTGVPVAAQQPEDESPLAVLSMTLVITHEGEVNSLAQDTLGALTVLVNGVECETLTFEDSAPTPVRIETQLGGGDQPDACHASGGAITFERGDGVPLFERAVFESGGLYELMNFAPGPPHTGGMLPAPSVGPTLEARSSGPCTDITIEAAGLTPGLIIHVLIQEVGQHTAGEIPGSPITTDEIGSFEVTVPTDQLPNADVCNFNHDGFAVTVVGDEAGKPGEKLAGPVYTQSAVVGPVAKQGGVSLVQWTGGAVDALAEAATLDGCDLASVWLTQDGRFLGHILGAPAFVNAAWAAEVGEQIAAQPLLLRCAPPPPGDTRRLDCPGDVNSVVIDYGGAFGYATPELALEGHLGSESLDLPSGTPVEVVTSDSRIVWELVADDGRVVAVLQAERVAGNWRVSGATWCA
ncbi:MAG: hypothetical protein GEU80_02115 [Dehalococcoidia bacterium]|nr:hypothetical protein [Dehalococcoidia bacterium]